MMKVVKQCILCGSNVEIVVTKEQAKELISPYRRNIQDILPNHTPAEREMFISGVCGKCCDEMYGDDTEGVGVQ